MPLARPAPRPWPAPAAALLSAPSLPTKARPALVRFALSIYAYVLRTSYLSIYSQCNVRKEGEVAMAGSCGRAFQRNVGRGLIEFLHI